MTFGGGFGRVFRPAFDPGLTALPWYRAGGAPLPVAAYQPKGASSLAASYVNLANPGTYDAAPGVAPTLDASGWVFNGSTQYLDTTYIMASVSASTIVRFSNSLEEAFAGVIGSRSSNGAVYYGITPYRSSVRHRFWNSNGSPVDETPAVVSGTMAIAGSTGYVNGAPDSALTISSVTGNSIKIASFMPTWGFWGGSIQAVVIYNTTLTAPQVAAVSAAMAAL